MPGPARILSPFPSSAHSSTEKSRFSQQQMWACRPIITPLYVVIIFLVVSVITIPLGVACIVAYAKVNTQLWTPHSARFRPLFAFMICGLYLCRISHAIHKND